MIKYTKNPLAKFVAIIILIFLFNCRSVRKRSFIDEFDYNPKKSADFRNTANHIAKVNEFRAKKIDFIVYRSYFVGGKRMNDKSSNLCSNCTPDFPIYLIWSENSKDYIQKIDNCGTFFPLELGTSEVTKFAYENFEIIKTEKLKYYLIKKNIIFMIDHSTFKNFLISKSGIESSHFFDVYNLSTNTDHKNINYEYNNGLKIIYLNNLIENQIKTLNSHDLFKRDFSTCKINSNHENIFRN